MCGSGHGDPSTILWTYGAGTEMGRRGEVDKILRVGVLAIACNQ